MNSTKEEQIESLKNLFYSLFREHGYSSYDSFSSNIWFIQNKVKPGYSAQEYFEDMIISTPKEDNDIINFILFNCAKNHSKYNNEEMRVFVSDFVDEIVKQILFLNEENIRIGELIDKYSAYETITTIEQNINYFDKYEEITSELTKSNFKAYIGKIKGIPSGKYKFSLLISKIKEMRDYIEHLEFPMQNQMQIISNNSDEINYKSNEYEFPLVDFFCSEGNKISADIDSGTNLLIFQIKMENIIKSDIILSERFKFVELLIGNSKNLMNNFEKVKKLEANINLQNSLYDINCLLVFKVEFDPFTLMSVFHKINKLLKNIISYKVRIEHKYKTILSYFESYRDKIEILLTPPEQKKVQKECLIF